MIAKYQASVAIEMPGHPGLQPQTFEFVTPIDTKITLELLEEEAKLVYDKEVMIIGYVLIGTTEPPENPTF